MYRSRLFFCILSALFVLTWAENALAVSLKPLPPLRENKDPEEAEKKAALLELREINGVIMLPIEANLISYTNEERRRRGLPPLEVDKELMNSAREHASWMTRTRRFIHTRRAVAENIAMGQPYSRAAVRAWMNSSGHRANILNPQHRRIGVGAFRTEHGTIYWCQQFRR